MSQRMKIPDRHSDVVPGWGVAKAGFIPPRAHLKYLLFKYRLRMLYAILNLHSPLLVLLQYFQSHSTHRVVAISAVV